MQADRKLWLTADRERVVEDGDPDAAFLLAAEGDELDDEDVERYGLNRSQKKAASAENKQTAPAENKAASTTAKKAAARTTKRR